MRQCSYRALGLTVLAITAAGAASATPRTMSILYHEVVDLGKEQAARTTGASTEQPAQRISFEAYGRRFDLVLEPNERLRGAIRGAPKQIRPLRGIVEGSPNSWVRLTRDADGSWSGMIVDGAEVYAIEPAANVAEAAVQPLAESDSTPVMYRLADTLLSLGPNFCGTSTTDEPPTALATFETLTEELQAQTAEAALTRKLRVGVVADYQFAQYFRSRSMNPEEAIVARMNIVDGIFSSQLGLKVELAQPELLGQADTSFTRTDASRLLDELRSYRRRSAQQSSLGLTHLMTGRNLDGETVGIAYMGAVCDPEYGVSLSEGTRSTTAAALIAAHEIGHNFDAPHDGEAGACESTPQTFLMASRLNGSDQFSACSLDRIRTLLGNRRRTSCLTEVLPADAAVEITSGTVQATADTPFTLSFAAGAVGGQDSTNVVATVTLPAELTLNSSAITQGSCASGAGAVSCTIGTLPAGQSREITLNLTGRTAGTFAMGISVTSDNDSSANNNSGQISVVVANPSPSPAQTSAGGSGTSSGAVGGGGGGGRTDPALLLLLAGLLTWSARSRRPVAAS